ncbi:hypothetical protein [Ulvibacter litoralis]|uniref:Cystatin domain-containing protein n=1 Tax=Ulvibacter litoralis TaxID=227084 RepID=A0A1G7I668_9FLAO|nr:hypothetical protein [Ulvibacter litoralis]GHC62455.1 hypothetical protein GCM10008083_29500 [Ulvibacter litoralis]SDF07924.1 hypothetical protein SAMN05421855_105104 [Ulvibacter litoralis]
MKSIFSFLLIFLVLACSTEKEQMQTIRDLAVRDSIEKLQLPKETIITHKDIVVSEEKINLENLGATYTVTITVASQNSTGEKVLDTHTLTYTKISEGGLSPHDYQLKSFE